VRTTTSRVVAVNNLLAYQASREDPGAATILRWLIGGNDHVPARGENLGELVGGFGDVARSPGEIVAILALALQQM
jgi:hypothetical protein